MRRNTYEILLNWQNIILADPQPTLIMSEQELIQSSIARAENDLRIIHDCLKIISETVNPDTFFMRLDLLKQKAHDLVVLEPYIHTTGASPTVAFNEIIQNEQQCIYEFLCRYYNATFDKAQKTKTENGKKNQYQKFYDSLQPYADKMNDHNINYLKYKIRDRL